MNVRIARKSRAVFWFRLKNGVISQHRVLDVQRTRSESDGLSCEPHQTLTRARRLRCGFVRFVSVNVLFDILQRLADFAP